jgi:hypothetical protein
LGGNQISKDPRYVDATKVYAPPPGADGKAHLNATLPPTHENAATEFTYLVTDGSDDGPYLEA